MQRAKDDMKRATNMHRATGNVQHATETPVLCRQRGNDNRRRAPGNKHATRKETTRQHAGLQQTTGNGQHATDNVHQTADGMQEDASTCEMQQETHGTAAFRVRRAAGSGQPTVCAKHCPRQPVRNTAQTPHTRCHIRPVPQHAANTRGTDNTQQAMQCTG